MTGRRVKNGCLGKLTGRSLRKTDEYLNQINGNMTVETLDNKVREGTTLTKNINATLLF